MGKGLENRLSGEVLLVCSFAAGVEVLLLFGNDDIRGLSETGRTGLRLIRLQVEGYRLSGEGTQTVQQVAREEIASALVRHVRSSV